MALRRSSKKIRADLESLREQMSALVEQVSSLTAADAARAGQLDDVVEKMKGLTGRIEQVGNEVTHQLGELSSDIDSIGARTESLGQNIAHLTELPSLVDGVRSDQARLANEQARYEIAFRQDLAEIADLLMKKRPT